MKKRGISTIVATVLIVLITVAAVTILWAAISPLIGQNLESGTKCFDVQDAVRIDADKRYTCYNATGGVNDPGLNVRVERMANTDALEGFEIIVTDGGNTLTNSVVVDKANLPTANGAKVFENGTALIDIVGTGDVLISIAPQVMIEGEATSCTGSREIEVQACS